MNLRALFFLIFCVITSLAKAQNQALTEDEDHIYWQQDVEIDYSHFQAKSDTACIKYHEKYGIKMSATMQLKGIVDIPKSHLKRKFKKRKGYDKAYLAPVFCKNCSCLLSEDSVELVVIQLLFDVAETSARGARKDLLEMQELMNINNVNSTYYTTVINKWDKIMRGTWASIYKDVLIEKKDSAYAEWRTLVDEILEENKDFATQPYEIKRLILGEPIEDGYVEPEFIIGDLKDDDEN